MLADSRAMVVRRARRGGVAVGCLGPGGAELLGVRRLCAGISRRPRRSDALGLLPWAGAHAAV